VFALFTVATWAPLANPHAWDDLGVTLLVAGGLGVCISIITYRRAVSQTDDWGAAVTALVNANRTKVANAFGLTLPESLGEEREFWRTLNGFVRTGSAGWESRYDRLERLPARPHSSQDPVTPHPDHDSSLLGPEQQIGLRSIVRQLLGRW
jgi:hypothetical protein